MPGEQGGLATLATILVLLFVSTITVLYIAYIGTREHELAGADLRSRQAFHASEAGIEFGAAYLTANRRLIGATTPGGWMTPGSERWRPCSGEDSALPCGDGVVPVYDESMLAYADVEDTIQPPAGGTYTLHFLTPSEAGAPAAVPLVHIVAEGRSSDGTATAVTSLRVLPVGLLENIPRTGLSVSSNISLSGNMRVWGNPDGQGMGQPLSLWSGGAVELKGNAATCGGTHPVCKPELSNKKRKGGDILESDPAFPSDLFEYLFGVPAGQSDVIKGQATILSDCSSMAVQPAGIYWVTGNCRLSSRGGDVGRLDEPVLLIVEGDLTLNGNIEVYGIVFLGEEGHIRLTGTPVLYGALLSAADIDFGGGGMEIVYDAATLNAAAKLGGGFVRLPGGWIDALR